MKKLKDRWGIQSNYQFAVVLLVFILTGSSSAYVTKPILAFLGITKESVPYLLYLVLKIVLIFPAYQVLLISFGFIFGQFRFFWNFEKKMLKMIGLGFLFKK
jgi:hypothetical protein